MNKTIIQVAADYQRAGLSRQQIARRLNQQGFRTVYGSLWSPSSMKALWPEIKRLSQDGG